MVFLTIIQLFYFDKIDFRQKNFFEIFDTPKVVLNPKSPAKWCFFLLSAPRHHILILESTQAFQDVAETDEHRRERHQNVRRVGIDQYEFLRFVSPVRSSYHI